MRASTSPEVVASLNSHVDALDPGLAWEIGPGSTAEWRFTLSPDSDEALSGVARDAISRAPQIPGWEFRAFRQPRDACLIVDVNTLRGAAQIDASDAEYALLRARDGTFDMVVKLPHARKLQTQDQHALGILLLDGLIGEEVRMSLIKNVQFVEEFEPRYRERTTNIKHLKDHLMQQIRRERDSQSAQ